MSTLGLKRNEVRLFDFTTKWEEEFQKTKENILQVIEIPEEAIQHIGSTSIKGMKAKPIIDILMGVDNLSEISEEGYVKLKSIGFYPLQVEMENEIVLAKFTDQTFEVKTHYIHLTTFQGRQWKEFIHFKERLQQDPTLRREYIRIKEQYISGNSEGIKEYTKHKEGFVKKVIETNRNN